MDKCMLISLETVLWCKLQRLEISLIQSQPLSADFRQRTIFMTFSAVSFRMTKHLAPGGADNILQYVKKNLRRFCTILTHCITFEKAQNAYRL